MQPRYLVVAALVHGTVILGAGLEVWAASQLERPPIELSVLLRQPALPLPEATPPEPEPEAGEESGEQPMDRLVEREVVWEPPITEPEVQDQPDPVYSVPTRFRAVEELLTRVRPPEPEPVAAPTPVVIHPQVAETFVEADALDERNEPPDYPPLARRRGVEGLVVLQVTVDLQGNVGGIEILLSAGSTRAHQALDQAAIAAVSKWRYQPATRGDRPVQSEVRLEVEFRIAG